MKQKNWSSQDVAFTSAASAAASEGAGTGPDRDAAFNALLQSAMAVSGGEGGGDTECWAGMPPFWTRSR